jgi:hypothetical protein
MVCAHSLMNIYTAGLWVREQLKLSIISTPKCELPSAQAGWLPGSPSIAILRWSYRLSPGVTSRGSRGSLFSYSQCFCLEVDCSIDLSVVYISAIGALPLANPHRQLIHNTAAVRTGRGGGIPAADFFHPTTVPGCFVFQDLHEL